MEQCKVWEEYIVDTWAGFDADVINSLKIWVS